MDTGQISQFLDVYGKVTACRKLRILPGVFIYLFFLSNAFKYVHSASVVQLDHVAIQLKQDLNFFLGGKGKFLNGGSISLVATDGNTRP